MQILFKAEPPIYDYSLAFCRQSFLLLVPVVIRRTNSYPAFLAENKALLNLNRYFRQPSGFVFLGVIPSRAICLSFSARDDCLCCGAAASLLSEDLS